jgi:hypothetical protein
MKKNDLALFNKIAEDQTIALLSSFNSSYYQLKSFLSEPSL